ncbi:MAG TPA: response regulator [Geothermobacteraceae bacterium]|nr:response regulator [Geothermobacteraceae bacterium]
MSYRNPDIQKGATVLLAEDNDELRELLAFCFYQAGYNVTSCNNGISLLERLQAGIEGDSTPIELVVTDIRMPGLTGLEVLESYFDQPELPPIICITAFGDRQTHEQALRLRAKAVFDKPFDIDLLVQSAKQLCPPVKNNHATRSLT